MTDDFGGWTETPTRIVRIRKLADPPETSDRIDDPAYAISLLWDLQLKLADEYKEGSRIQKRLTFAAVWLLDDIRVRLSAKTTGEKPWRPAR